MRVVTTGWAITLLLCFYSDRGFVVRVLCLFGASSGRWWLERAHGVPHNAFRIYPDPIARRFCCRWTLRPPVLKLAGELPISEKKRWESASRISVPVGCGNRIGMARTRLRGLEIGGIQMGIEVPDDYDWQWPDGELADFACLAREPEVHVGIRVGDVVGGDLGGERYALGAWTFEVGRRGDDWILGLSRAGHREQIALFDAEFLAGEIVVSRDLARRPGYPLRGPLDEWLVLHRTVSRGGLCLMANAVPARGWANVRLGVVEPDSGARWTTPGPTLFGSNSLLLREVQGVLRAFRTPWGRAMAPGLGRQVRVREVVRSEPSEHSYLDVLDPDDAADLLVKHAVVPVSDDGIFEQVLRNARRIAGGVRCLRVGESGSPSIRVGMPPRLQPALAFPGDVV